MPVCTPRSTAPASPTVVVVQLETVWLRVAGGEEGLAEQEKQRKAAEQAAWQAKVVVADTAFHAGGPRVAKPGQLDRNRGILRDAPVKLALKKAHAGVPPVSMFLGEPRVDAGFGRSESPAMFMEPGVDFVSAVAKEKSALSQPGFTQSWWGSLHDAHLEP